MQAKRIRTAAVLCMIASPLARAWDEHKALDFILDHHPRVQAQREAVSAEKSLNRLPVLEAMMSERSSATAALDAAERAEAQVRETAREQTAAAQRAVETAATAPERDAAVKALSRTAQTTASARANAAAALEQARIEARYEEYDQQRREALTELGQLRRRLAEKATRRYDQETQTGEIRQTALGDLEKLRELEADRAAAATRLSFLKVKSGWLQKQVAQGHPEDALWENAQRQNAETATLNRIDLLIEAQRQHTAQRAGDHWQTLYRYLAGVSP